MINLFIIVNEQDVKNESEAGIVPGIYAYRKILDIKNECQHRNVDGSQVEIPEDLPLPGTCKVRVCGSGLDGIIPKIVEALKDRGYISFVHKAASIY
jgi:hypothetical protein